MLVIVAAHARNRARRPGTLPENCGPEDVRRYQRAAKSNDRLASERPLPASSPPSLLSAKCGCSLARCPGCLYGRLPRGRVRFTWTTENRYTASAARKGYSSASGCPPITVTRARISFPGKSQVKGAELVFLLSTAMNYWGKYRLYHHTPRVRLIYALREAMRIGWRRPRSRWAKHKLNQQARVAALRRLGLKLLVGKFPKNLAC